MNFKNVIPFAALLVCSMGNPAQVEARTPQVVSGICTTMFDTTEADYACSVTPDGGMGYIVRPTAGGKHFYVNPVGGEFSYGYNHCLKPVFNQNGNSVSAMCASSELLWTVIFPTR